jgi:deoxyribose-phosphate aldolase
MGSEVRISAVVGFPHGNSAPETKIHEAVRAIDDGAKELDMVVAIGRVRSGAWDWVERDIAGVIEAAHPRGALVKVILEDCFLTDAEVVSCCALIERLGGDFVKTSTGYGPGGATVERVKLMRRSCSEKVGVKAAGGIRTLDQFLRILSAGAAQQGTRSTKAIMEEALRREREGTLARALAE